MNENQIKYMVERFLGWNLPKDFRPDGGISFDQVMPQGGHRKPVGTNLLTATQAEDMIRHLTEGIPE